MNAHQIRCLLLCLGLAACGTDPAAVTRDTSTADGGDTVLLPDSGEDTGTETTGGDVDAVAPDASDASDASDAGDGSGGSDASDATDATETVVPCDDADKDGVCDDVDLCAGFDDALDDDGDGRPDACDCDTDDVCGPGTTCTESTVVGEPVICDCAPGYSGIWQNCVDIDECETNNGGCDHRTECINTAGSRDCGPCPAGSTGDGEVGCDDINECLDDHGGCDPLVTCTNTTGSRTCGDCPVGYSGTGETGCTDIDECAVDHGGCDPLVQCTNSDGGYGCGLCPSGYTGTGDAGCVDIDECLLDNGGCDLLTDCINVAGSRFCSDCPGGYGGDGEAGCVDIDECAPDLSTCDPLTTCSNEPVGSFTCGACPLGYAGTGLSGCVACPSGYFGTPDKGCVDIDECADLDTNGGCDPLVTCTNTPGDRVCGPCPGGYTGDGVAGCVNVDECATGNGGCDALTACVDLPGTFSCGPCPAGYTGDGLAGCENIDECASGNGGCDALTACFDSPGSFSCGPCPAGYTGDGLAGCDNVDECASENGGCDALIACIDAPGSFSCGPCPPGYSGDGVVGCVDIDECADANGGCDALTSCTNTAGSRDCGACPPGYSGDGLAGCADIDECAVANGGCDALTTCSNAPAGSFTCGACPSGYAGTGSAGCVACPGGYVGTPDKGCVDVNECADLDTNGGCDPFVRCINRLGQPRECGPCPDGFTGDGVTGCVEGSPLESGVTESGGATQAEMDQVLLDWKPTLPPDRNELVPQPGVAVTTPAQANHVIVTPEALKFSLSAHPEVLEWEPGRIITSRNGDGGGGGYNPFGFMRKVREVQVNGDEVLILTTVPALEEVVTGELQMEFDPTTARVIEWDEFDHAWAADHLYVDVGIVGDHFPERLTNDESAPDVGADGKILGGDPGFFDDLANVAVDAWESVVPNSFGGSLRLDKEPSLGAKTGVLSYDFSKSWTNPDMVAKFEGTGEFEGSMQFNPRTSLSVRIPNPIGAHPEPFRIGMDIDAYLNTKLDIDLILQASIASSGGAAGSELEQKIKQSEDFAQKTLTYFKVKSLGDPAAKPAGGWKKVLFISKPSSQWIAAGPVPVMFTQTFQLDLECGFEVKASLHVNVKNHTARTLKFKAAYEWGGGGSIEGPAFNSETNRSITVEGGGEASVSCGLIPRVNAFVYDSVGINLGVRGSGVVKATYASKCDPDLAKPVAPKGTVTLGLFANIGIQFGGRVQTPGSSYAGKGGTDLGFDIGPYELWTKEIPIIKRDWDVPGLGYCPPICRDTAFAHPDRETDVDCGGDCPAPCVLTQRCKVNRDCAKGSYCIPPGVCDENHCLDGVLSGSETATDCGGQKCAEKGAACGLGRRCIENRDCASGLCAKGRAVAPDSGAGFCVDDPCLDNQVSPGECGRDCGGPCAKCKNGAACSIGSECASGVSNGYSCALSTCANLKIDGTETDIDCGGGLLCYRCAPGKRCLANSDCSAAAPVCDPDPADPTRKVCSKAQCLNELAENPPLETDIDCGGICHEKCIADEGCSSYADCALGLDCKPGAQICAAPTCDDGWKARLEGDVDCGKGCDTKCALGQTCGLAKDCASGICTGGHCVATDCFDHLKNGDESDVDCGGSCTRRCAADKVCGISGDCESNNCVGTVCAAATCADAVTNGNESDVDCGGGCSGCDTGGDCRSAGDCESAVCGAARTCVAPTCDDGKRNGGEGDVDCGGGCGTRCALGARCNVGGDCTTETCIVGTCAEASCGDLVLDGSETDVDCGGTCPAKCAEGQGCDSGGDCASGSCGVNACLAPACNDGVKNADETDVDCGGGCDVEFGAKCGDDKGCAADSDCASGVCDGWLCLAPSCTDAVQNGDELGVDCGGACDPCRAVAIGPDLTSLGSNPRHFVAFGGAFYFKASDFEHGEEWWVSDGTPAGTRLLKDIAPGTAGAFPSGPVVPGPSVVLGDFFYFAANDGVHGHELWRSDGTAGGTLMVKDIRDGATGSGVTELIVNDGKLWFQADDGVTGPELWVSDGSAGGTELVKDILASGASGSSPSRIVGGIGRVFFQADDGVHGRELWTSDGTAAGTSMLRDLNPGSASGLHSSYSAAAVDVTLFFAADDGVDGVELWMSDGTTDGTVQVKDIQTGTGAGNPSGFMRFGDSVYFSASSSANDPNLWKSDGTEVGTVMVKDLWPQPGYGVTPLGVANGLLYFTARNATAAYEFWQTDGTSAGTVSVPGAPASSSSLPQGFAAVGAAAYVGMDDGVHGREPWIVEAGGAARMVLDVGAGRASNTPRSGLYYITEFVALGGAVFFSGDDGLGSGYELFTSDGTEAGTVRVKDCNGSPDTQLASVLIDAGAALVFAAADREAGLEPWKSDGTEAGTQRIADVNPGADDSVVLYSSGSNALRQATAAGGALYFGADDGTHGIELWRSDLTEAGTTMLTEIRAGKVDPSFGPFKAVGSRVYFAADNGVVGNELWKTDGSSADTVLVKDLNPLAESSNPNGLVAFNGKIYFQAYGQYPNQFGGFSYSGRELFASGGDAASTGIVKDIRSGSGSSDVNPILATSQYLYVSAIADGYDRELVRSDGTDAGTVVVKDISPGAFSGTNIQFMVAVGNTVYFSANSALWRSDGSGPGTVSVKAFPAAPTQTVAVGSTVYFVVNDSVHGAEIWKSNGTEAGTVLLKDIVAGSAGSAPGNLTAGGGRLYFTADDGVTGEELWESDGTEAGTKLALDLAPAGSSWPRSLLYRAAENALYFVGYDGAARTLRRHIPAP
ncbi:MAG: hypothetical protein R3F39_23285 [Myxococcota bacterium]